MIVIMTTICCTCFLGMGQCDGSNGSYSNSFKVSIIMQWIYILLRKSRGSSFALVEATVAKDRPCLIQHSRTVVESGVLSSFQVD